VNFKPAVAALVGDRVRFVDSSVEPIDVIVWSTGYKITFPFFDEDFISAPDNELFLYRRVFKPGIDNLFFVALLQPLGPTMPIAEAQGRWIAAYLRGEYRLPTVGEMESEIRRERARLRRRYVASKRHTMEVDFDDYLYALRRELRAGARRARAGAFRLPVPARARAVAAAAGPGG
jgi:dimethylaniline monooxygenase (N-oxide forming)